MKILMNKLAALGAVALVTGLLTLISFIAIWPAATTAHAWAAGDQEAKTTFNHKCAVCHGKDGAGRSIVGKSLKMVDLRSADVQKLTDAELAKVISNGKDEMPAFGGELSKSQIAGLVGYIRTFAKAKSSSSK